MSFPLAARARKLAWLGTGTGCQVLPKSSERCNVPSEVSVHRGAAMGRNIPIRGRSAPAAGGADNASPFEAGSASLALPRTSLVAVADSTGNEAFPVTGGAGAIFVTAATPCFTSGTGAETAFSATLGASVCWTAPDVIDFPRDGRCRLTAAATTTTAATAAPQRNTGQFSQCEGADADVGRAAS